MPIGNLFEKIPDTVPDELFEALVACDGVRIERIVSEGHASPEGFWYDQPQHEWVMVLRGSAGLRFEDDPAPVVLRPGDWVNIPAHRKHRVEWTDPAGKTIWLAVHYPIKDPVSG